MADLFQLFRHNPQPSIQYSNHHQPSQPVRTFQHQNVYSAPTQQHGNAPARIVTSHQPPRSDQRVGIVQSKSNQDLWASQPDKNDGLRIHHSPSRPQNHTRTNVYPGHSAQTPQASLGYTSAPRYQNTPQPHPYSNMQTGVGIEFESGRLVVASLVVGCSAARSSEVEVGDEMVAVEGYEDIDFSRARSLILGRPGTFVTLTFRRRQQRFKVKLMRGSQDYLEMLDQFNAADTQRKELEEQVSKLVAENDKLEGLLHASGQNSQQQEYVNGLQTRVKELESEVQTMKRERQEAQDVLLSQKNEEIRQKTSENDLLRMQVSSLQKLIGEKDGQVTQTKVKAREQQTAMAVRLRDAEELLKDRVAAKNAEIDDLKNQLENAQTELDNLRTENKKLRDKGMSDLDHITFKPVADNRTSLDFDDRNSEPPAQPKSFPVPKLPLASLNNPVQTFQHEQQQVQFQGNSARKESHSSHDPVPELQVTSSQQLSKHPSTPQRQLLNDSAAPHSRDTSSSPQPWGVKPAPRSQLPSTSPQTSNRFTSAPPSPSSSGFVPAPSPNASPERRNTLTPPSNTRPSPAISHRDPLGSPGDVQLSQRPGTVSSRFVSRTPSAPAPTLSAHATTDVSFRTRAHHASSPYSLPPYAATPPPQYPMGSFSLGQPSFPSLSYMAPPPMHFNSSPWGGRW